MDHVFELLKKKGVPFTVSGRDFVVSCLNPEHTDKNPSCRIDKVTGVTHCLSCGFKTNIFKFFGITGAQRSVKIAKLKEKLADLYANTNGLDLPEGSVPYTKVFRGISKNTLTKFGAFYNNREDLADRIFFPVVNIRGKTQVFIGRHLMSEGNPRYLFHPAHTAPNLLPCVYPKKYSSMILVEGIFDMLNLHDKGIENCSCTFGTSTMQNNTSEKMLPFKTMGITKVFILYDGDKAGRDAAKKIKPLIEELDFIVEIIDLPDDSDPGDLNQEDVDQIKAYINEENSDH